MPVPIPSCHNVSVISTELLARLGLFVELRMGLHFPPNRLNDLERGIHATAADLGFTDTGRCIEWLLNTPLSPAAIETLAGHLTIGETYFFRDHRLFELLETSILSKILNERRGRERSLRIWSAGCATGEEAYSLAILLCKMLPDPAGWHITILATDIAPLCLRRAAEGVYGSWSFRDTPRWAIEGYFEKRGQQMVIAPRIRQMVTFAHLNLAEDVYPAILNTTNGMDLIVCRNVLMYFSPQRALTVMEKFSRCLVDGGWLAVGPAEAPASRLPPFLHPVSFPGAVLFRKGPPKEGETISRPAAGAVRPPIQTNNPPAAECRLPPPPVVGGSPAVAPPMPEAHEAGTRAASARARELADLGRLAEALALCTEAIGRDKLDPAMHYLQATILQEMDRGDEAAAALQRAIYIDQDFAVAHFALGHLLSRQGKSRLAARHLQRARTLLQAISPDDSPAEAEGMRAGRLVQLIDRMENMP